MASKFLAKLNSLLPADLEISNAKINHVKSSSEELGIHVIIDQLENLLKTLDDKHQIRQWQNTWAHDILKTRQFVFMREPYISSSEQRDARRELVAYVLRKDAAPFEEFRFESPQTV